MENHKNTHTLQHQTWRRLQKKMGTKKSRDIKTRTTIDGYQLIAAPLSKDRSWTIICIGHIQHLVHGHHPINFRFEVEWTVARESMWWDTVYPPYNMQLSVPKVCGCCSFHWCNKMQVGLTIQRSNPCYDRLDHDGPCILKIEKKKSHMGEWNGNHSIGDKKNGQLW